MGSPAKVLGEADLRRVLNTVRHGPFPTRDEAMLLLSVKAGLRAKEMAGLAWPMVLTANGKLSSHICLPGTITKRAKARRVPIHPALVPVLKRLSSEQGRPTRGAVLAPAEGRT